MGFGGIFFFGWLVVVFVWGFFDQFFLNVCLITDLMGREKLPANGFMICHSCSLQEKERAVPFNARLWTELVLKY